jgi:hypothetical protein
MDMHHRLHVGADLVDARVNFDFRALSDPGRCIDQETLGVADDHILSTHNGQGVQRVFPAFDHKAVRL